jgi:multiple antibiotic resistance protein
MGLSQKSGEMPMHQLVLFTGTVFMGFFAIMNPLANTPVFLGLTADDDSATRRAVALKGLALAFLIVAIFSVAGKYIFDLFGITLPAFRIAGGILVFQIGLHMLHGEQSKAQQPVHQAADDSSRAAQLSVAVSPLAVPILAGPGTIATAMNFVAVRSVTHLAITIGVFALMCGISYVFFVSGGKLVRYVGDNAVDVVTRMMGLILAVIGVQMLIEGIHGAVQAYR